MDGEPLTLKCKELPGEAPKPCCSLFIRWLPSSPPLQLPCWCALGSSVMGQMKYPSSSSLSVSESPSWPAPEVWLPPTPSRRKMRSSSAMLPGCPWYPRGGVAQPEFLGNCCGESPEKGKREGGCWGRRRQAPWHLIYMQLGTRAGDLRLKPHCPSGGTGGGT